MKKFLILAIIISLSVITFGQHALAVNEPSMVKDINLVPDASGPWNIITVGSDLYYFALSSESVTGLYKFNTISQQRTLIFGEFPQGQEGNLMSFNGLLFFTVGESPVSLWVSDGTTEGTRFLKTIDPDGGTFGEFVVSNNILFFIAKTEELGWELWKTDGTDVGTVLVRDLVEGSESSSPYNLISYNNLLYFCTTGPSLTGIEIWRTDGTENGTEFFYNETPSSGPFMPYNFFVADNLLYFVLQLNVNDYIGQLYRTDGTSNGTFNISLNDKFGASYMTSSGGQTYFVALDANEDTGLYKTDGTLVGTERIAEVNPTGLPDIRNLTDAEGTLYFSATDGVHGIELWRWDGTIGQAVMVKDINTGGNGDSWPAQMINVNGTLYFNVGNSVYGYELWRSDGTANGTVLVKDINSGTSSSDITGYIRNVGANIYFQATDGIHGSVLWKSDGTEAGTVMADYKSISSTPTSLGGNNGVVYFSAYDSGTYSTSRPLWRSDGTEAGTYILKDISPGNDVNAHSFTFINNIMYFIASDGYADLWRSDGTEAGTYIVKDLISPTENGFGYLIGIGQTLFFTVTDGVHGVELWKTDGTEGGTAMVADIYPGFNGPSISNLADVNGVLFFNATNGASGNGDELWKSDGTEAGTVMVKDIISGAGSSNPTNFVVVGDELYFFASDNSHGKELWKSDGTEEGTVMVKDVRNGATGSGPDNLTNVNGVLFFTANDGVVANGLQSLWKSDGTETGTVLVRADTSATVLTNVNGVLFFNNGGELWKSDGTEAGTVIVKDINPGDEPSNPSNLTRVGNRLLFTAYNEEYGTQLWQSDGTEDGTFVHNVLDSQANRNETPINLTNVNGTLFYGANDGVHGTELWSYTPNSPPTLTSITPSFSSTTGLVSVSTTLTDEDGDISSLLVDYSLDNGTTWSSSTINTVSATTLGSISTSTGQINNISSTLAGNTLTFTWNTKADSVGSSTTAKLRLTPNDGTRNGTTITSSAFTIDNTPLITLSLTTLNITRSGSDTSSDSIYVRLNTKPTANVTLTPTLSSPNSLTFNQPTLTFTSSNWNTPQSLIVYTVSTSTATSFDITFNVLSADTNYNNLSPNASTTVAITITNRSSSSTGSGGGSGCSGLCGSGGSSAPNPTTGNNTPTQISSTNQVTVITSPLTQTVTNTAIFNNNNTSASLTISPGTLANPSTLEIVPKESVSVVLPNNLSGGSIDTFSKPIGDVVFDIVLKDNTTNKELTSFTTNSLDLTINLPSLSLDEDTTKLGLYYLNETTNQWLRVSNAVFNTITKQVTASLNHLTKFAVFKSSEYTLNTDQTSVEDQAIVNNQTPPEADWSWAEKLSAKQLNTYAGKFVADNNNNIFYVDKKTKKLELVTKDNATKYLAKTALGINNKDLNKINITTDKKVTSYSKKFAGKVLIQVQNKGKLWYVDKTGRKNEVYDAWGLVKGMSVKLK